MCCRRGWYLFTLSGYLGTFALLMAWYSVLAPSPHFPVSLVLLVLGTPLLFPLRGLLHGRNYTYSWSAFLALAYFVHGVLEATHAPETRWLGVAEVILTAIWFGGAIMFVRVGRELEDR